MSDILKAISEDIAAGAEYTKPKPEPPKRAPLPKISKAEAKRRATKLKRERASTQSRLDSINTKLNKIRTAEKDLREQCPHPKEYIESGGFDYFIETCTLCGNSEVY